MADLSHELIACTARACSIFMRVESSHDTVWPIGEEVERKTSCWRASHCHSLLFPPQRLQSAVAAPVAIYISVFLSLKTLRYGKADLFLLRIVGIYTEIESLVHYKRDKVKNKSLPLSKTCFWSKKIHSARRELSVCYREVSLAAVRRLLLLPVYNHSHYWLFSSAWERRACC